MISERITLIALHEMESVGWTTINRLQQGLSSLMEMWNLSKKELLFLGLGPKQADAIIQQRSMELIENKLRIYEQAAIQIVTILDDSYPELLRTIAQPPKVLYAAGELSLLQLPFIGIVGTRTPTVYGKKVADDLAYELASLGFGVVSGLARGIDTVAHRGALRADQGMTVAVLGNAIGDVYPPENTGFYRDITARGLVISEYPMGTKQHPGMFPQRNRIIAGLSLGIVVIEAAERSGSLITADLALEASRDVFAVPGPITSPKSKGCHELIKQGAKLVCTTQDIAEEYQHLPILASNRRNLEQSCSDTDQKLTDEERKIVELLMGEPKTFDRLLELSHYNFGLLHSVLLSLLMKKRIASLPGSTYISF
ncbi:DNA-protecting protein DprA [Paenibacillus albiflavus]|uniref:DNA-protecting protein DprA n=2 Tax=Paenibacillus albiflavus TaxID=2545760 RepID=A0A4R4EJR8_9BACL|nr:DNA-protecting protein DprA [Paenibacillus albiflavus]